MKGTVVLMSPVHWHFTWQSAQKVATGLAERGFHVLFIEPLPKRWPRLSEALRVWGRVSGRGHLAGEGRQPLVSGVEIISPLLLPDAGHFAQAINRTFFVPRLAQVLERRNLKRPLITINFVPLHVALALRDKLNPDVSVYYCVYDWPNDPYSGQSKHFVEAEMASTANIVFSDTDHNVQRLTQYQNDVIQIFPSVDYNLFAPARSRVKSRSREQPRCAYFGTVGLSVDLELLERVSYRYTLRLIGPSQCDLSGLSPNTELLGAVPFTEVPGLLRDVDILLLPYRRAPHMNGVIPAKLFECLATGKPTVVIGLTTLGPFRDMFTVCNTHDEFLEAIERTYKNDTDTRRAARLACARENSGQQRINQIEEAINAVL